MLVIQFEHIKDSLIFLSVLTRMKFIMQLSYSLDRSTMSNTSEPNYINHALQLETTSGSALGIEIYIEI